MEDIQVHGSHGFTAGRTGEDWKRRESNGDFPTRSSTHEPKEGNGERLAPIRSPQDSPMSVRRMSVGQ